MRICFTGKLKKVFRVSFLVNVDFTGGFWSGLRAGLAGNLGDVFNGGVHRKSWKNGSKKIIV